jgi:predicted nucleic acid-binding protein
MRTLEASNLERAVLDACVLFPAVLRDTLLRSAVRGLYQCRWSWEILEEVRRNLVASGRASEGQAERLIMTLREQFEEAEVPRSNRLIALMTNDPKDRHVAATAVAASARVIVTINLKDFPARALEPFGVEAQGPDVFLSHLFHVDPNTTVDIIVRQAAALRNPSVAVDTILAKLSLFAPEFVQQVRQSRENGGTTV